MEWYDIDPDEQAHRRSRASKWKGSSAPSKYASVEEVHQYLTDQEGPPPGYTPKRGKRRDKLK